MLTFINEYLRSNTLGDKLSLFFLQHNEHRIAYVRMWTLISYKVNGEVNFNFISFIGNLSLVGIAAIFFKKFKETENNLLLFFPILILIFNLTSWENITYPLATTSNFTVYFFILLSLYFLTLDTKYKRINILYAALFFIAAIYTQGGGMFLFPVSIMILLYKKEYKNLIIYSLFTSLFVLGYFYGYSSYGQNRPITETIIESRELIFQFVFAFIGNAFNFYRIFTENVDQSILTTTIIGSLFFLGFLFLTYKKYYEKNLFIYSILLLVIALSFVTAISRIHLGIETASAPRYRINGIIFTSALYVCLVEIFNLNKKKYVATIITLSLIYFYFFSYKQYEYMLIREKQTIVGILAFNSGNNTLLNGDKLQVMMNSETLIESKNLKTFTLPGNMEFLYRYPISKEVKSNIFESNTGLPLIYSVETVLELKDDYFIDGWAFIEGLNTTTQRVFIGIKNKNDYFPKYFTTIQASKFDLNPYFKKTNLEKGGYTGRIRKSEVQMGENEVYLMVLNHTDVVIMKTDKIITKN